jgi:hypothetical protein
MNTCFNKKENDMEYHYKLTSDEKHWNNNFFQVIQATWLPFAFFMEDETYVKNIRH